MDILIFIGAGIYTLIVFSLGMFAATEVMING